MTARILTVEDEPDIALAISAVLQRAGYQVSQAADGPAALAVVRDQPPDVVLLDIGLPGMDGWEVLARIRDHSDVPVLMLTAHTAEDEKIGALHSGADDYLTKPFANAILVARVRALLRRRRSAAGPGASS
jgi:DNA-binding response OmpR family regulator